MNKTLEQQLEQVDKDLRGIESLGFKPILSSEGTLIEYEGHVMFKRLNVYICYNKKTRHYHGIPERQVMRALYPNKKKT